MSVFSSALVLAAVLFETQQGGVGLKVSSDVVAVDPARSVFVTVEMTCPSGKSATLPDLRERVTGFSLAEDFVEEPVTEKDGSVRSVANWRLVPEPCAEAYKIRPFVVPVRASDGKDLSFVGGPVRFEQPAPREPVTGEMEVEAKKDLPPFSWRLVGYVVAALLVLAGVGGLVTMGVKYLVRRVKEHRMSPIERAWVELDRLLKKGLPGRGRYKDFYVELTMVVRRYIQRKYGIRAPHLTTEEFLREAKPSDELRRFLESADMVKFAGVEATPDMADAATDSARVYLKGDNAAEGRK